jgi:hypothetical protein
MKVMVIAHKFCGHLRVGVDGWTVRVVSGSCAVEGLRWRCEFNDTEKSVDTFHQLSLSPAVDEGTVQTKLCCKVFELGKRHCVPTSNFKFLNIIHGIFELVRKTTSLSRIQRVKDCSMHNSLNHRQGVKTTEMAKNAKIFLRKI